MSARCWALAGVAALLLLGMAALLGRWMPAASHVPVSPATAEPILQEPIGAPGPTHETEPEKHSIRSSHGVHAGIMAF